MEIYVVTILGIVHQIITPDMLHLDLEAPSLLHLICYDYNIQLHYITFNIITLHHIQSIYSIPVVCLFYILLHVCSIPKKREGKTYLLHLMV